MIKSYPLIINSFSLPVASFSSIVCCIVLWWNRFTLLILGKWFALDLSFIDFLLFKYLLRIDFLIAFVPSSKYSFAYSFEFWNTPEILIPWLHSSISLLIFGFNWRICLGRTRSLFNARISFTKWHERNTCNYLRFVILIVSVIC